MTDITKYKNVSLPKETYNEITKLQSVMVPANRRTKKTVGKLSCKTTLYAGCNVSNNVGKFITNQGSRNSKQTCI